MWISVKAKEGDTLQTLAKQYKNKDPQAICLYRGNKKIANDLKSGKPLPKGTVVWVLDPKGKVYIIKDKRGKDVVLDKKGYEAHLKMVHRSMDSELTKQRLDIEYALGRHDAQNKINDEHYIISWIADSLSSVDEPKTSRKIAEGAYSAFKTAVKSRNYKQFEATAKFSDKMIVDYTSAVHAWIDGLIEGATKGQKYATHLKTAGELAASVIVVTVAAPASLGAAVAVGAASAGGSSLGFDLVEQASRAGHGVKLLSAKDIVGKAAGSALAGAGGALIAGNVIKLARGPFLKIIGGNAFMKSAALKISQRSICQKLIGNRIFQIEANLIADRLAKQGSKATIDTYMKFLSHDAIVLETLHKFLVRTGMGSLGKAFGAGGKAEALMLKLLRANQDVLKQKSESKIGKGAAKLMAQSEEVFELLDEAIKSNAKELQSVFRDVLRAHMETVAKKEKA